MNQAGIKRQQLLQTLELARTESPALARVIDLHSTQAAGYASSGYCEGCDGGPDYGGDWPCRTIRVIADTYDHEGSHE